LAALRDLAVRCNFSVAELSLLPSKIRHKAYVAVFCSLMRHFLFVPRAERDGCVNFRSEEPMHNEWLIGITSGGLRFSDEIGVTVFICSAPKIHKIFA
jgi:hypothetical protein